MAASTERPIAASHDMQAASTLDFDHLNHARRRRAVA
jgi:hypothetical protein